MDDSTNPNEALTEEALPPQENPVAETTPADAVPPPAPEDQSAQEQVELEPVPEPSAAHRVLLEIESKFHHLELLPQQTAAWFREKLAELKSLL